MKNKYEELMDNIKLKVDPKEEVRQAVFNNEAKSNKKYVGIKVVLAICSVLLLVVLPNFNHLFNVSNNSFTIQADESFYEIQKGNLIINELDLSGDQSSAMILNFLPENDDTVVIRYFSLLPQTLYVEGENIETVSYQLNQGTFVKLKEVYDLDDYANEEINPRSENSTGLFTPKDRDSISTIMKERFNIQDDPNKTYWEVLKAGSKIEIPYESQNTIDTIYCINPMVLYKDLSEEEKKVWEQGYYNDNFDYDNKLFEALNKIEMEIRVDYKDGTFETEVVKFQIDEETFKLNFLNESN